MDKNIKDLLGYHFRNPVPPALFIFSGFFVINSIISSMFIKYSALTFVYAIAMNSLYYFQDENPFLKKYHIIIQAILFTLWAVGMLRLIQYGMLFNPRELG